MPRKIQKQQHSVPVRGNRARAQRTLGTAKPF
jgi:hypothetical protein